MKNIKPLANQFRDAIDIARETGVFNSDFSFYKFPQGCCGDTSDLLAHFLKEHSIRTYYVCGTYRQYSYEQAQSHAWLSLDNQMIIDITGDQFKDNLNFFNYRIPVYVGPVDAFHRLFVVEDRDIHENNGLDALGTARLRLKELYQQIINFI